MCKVTIDKEIQNIKYELFFEDSDLKDTEEKFTSRDVNFNLLRNGEERKINA